MITLTTIAVPSFILALLLEVALCRIRKHPYYELHDTWVNFVCGLIALLAGLAMHAVAFVIYTLLQHIAPWNLGTGWWAVALTFIVSDFIAYWYHRLGHKSRFFWAGHQAHHSSEHFNLSVGLRTPFHVTHRFIFWAPMALMGFEPWLIVLADQVAAIYGFFLHTQVVRKLPRIIEFIFVTPSHHRAHHGSNDCYIDKNFGNTLILWDRMFGTFQEEGEPVVYGLVHPIKSKNPLRVQFGEYLELFRDLIRMKAPREIWQVMFGRPK